MPRKPDHRRKHGTETTYQWHLKKDTPPICEPCRKAHKQYAKDQRRRRQAERMYIRWVLEGYDARKETKSPLLDLNARDLDRAIHNLKKQLSLLPDDPPYFRRQHAQRRPDPQKPGRKTDKERARLAQEAQLEHHQDPTE